MVSSTGRKTHAHEYEQRAHRRGCTELVEALGTTAMQNLTPLLDGFSTLEAFLSPNAQPGKKNKNKYIGCHAKLGVMAFVLSIHVQLVP
jgi:hypothetical protein